MSTNSPAAEMTLSRYIKASRRSEDADKPSVEIFVAISAVNVAMVAVIAEKVRSDIQNFAAGSDSST